MSDLCHNRAVREAALVPGSLVLSECSCLDPPAQEVLCVPVTIKILFSHLKKKKKGNTRLFSLMNVGYIIPKYYHTESSIIF